MKFCIDDADVEKIRKIYEYYPVDGVSTNPSILAKVGREPYEVLTEIRDIIGEEGELFVQAVSCDAVFEEYPTPKSTSLSTFMLNTGEEVN